MKIAYKHLINFIPSKPSIEDISEKFFQLGHEHEIEKNIFNMELTPNRGDCLSINGLLRDLAVFYKVNLINEVYTDDIKSMNLDFNNSAIDACSHISFLKIDIVGEIRSYKGYLKEYFDDLDVNKNNFFTDISNYISYETGQPTHCYDAQKLSGSFKLERIKGEHVFETLLGKKIELNGKNLLFTKDNNIINLAGIMGAKNTSCSTNTKSVIVECAHFKPEEIIGKSVKYDIKSDSAHKFERGVDPLCHERVLRRFLKIVEDHARIVNVEIFEKIYNEHETLHIDFNPDRINAILGISLRKKGIEDYLLKLGFFIKDNKISVPSYRTDIRSENDIAEEIARIIGYNNIPSKPFQIPALTINENKIDIEHNIKKLLIDHGFFEVINSPFIKYEANNALKVDNPLDSNRKYIRTSLKESLIDNLLYNQRRQQDSIKLFEISDVYYFEEKIKFKKMLGIICSGRVARNYRDFSKKIDTNYLTNIIKQLSPEIDLHPVIIDNESLDSKSRNQIIYFEVEIDNLKNANLKIPSSPKKYSNDGFNKYNPISEYPSSSRDLSFSVKDSNKRHQLEDFLLNYKHDLIKEIFIFDYFYDKKNHEIKMGFRFVFQSKASTITESEVNNLMSDIIKASLAFNSVSIPGLK